MPDLLSPLRLVRTIFGRGGVQMLDGAAHRHRKRLFMGLMTCENIGRLIAIADEEWQAAAQRWTRMPRVMLYDEAVHVLARAVCAWAGVPLPESQRAPRARQLEALYDGAGAVGPRHWAARQARRSVDAWAREVVAGIRNGDIRPALECPAARIALHRDLEHRLLDERIAAVELVNLLRPTVAVSVFIAHVAHALHTQPRSHSRLAASEEGFESLFVQEVRRAYPFFPAVVARVRETFAWQGYRFPAGRRVLLDLYGTDHDPRTWERPDEFDPDRFRSGTTASSTLSPRAAAITTRRIDVRASGSRSDS